MTDSERNTRMVLRDILFYLQNKVNLPENKYKEWKEQLEIDFEEQQ